MEKSYSESYAAAGVDITAGYRSVELMKQYVAQSGAGSYIVDSRSLLLLCSVLACGLNVVLALLECAAV